MAAHLRQNKSFSPSPRKPTGKLATSVFKCCDWMKVLAVSLGFAMIGKKPLARKFVVASSLARIYLKI